MNVHFDLIASPIILGILFVMMVSTNIFMMKSGAESTVTQQLQGVANNALTVVENEIKYLSEVDVALDSTLLFVERTAPDADPYDVLITKNGDYLNVTRTPQSGGASTTQSYYLKLEDIRFEETQHGTSSAPFLTVTVMVKS